MSVDLLNDAEVLTTIPKTIEMQEALSGPVSCYLLTIGNHANGLLSCTTRGDAKAVASLLTRVWKVHVVKPFKLYRAFALIVPSAWSYTGIL